MIESPNNSELAAAASQNSGQLVNYSRWLCDLTALCMQEYMLLQNVK